MDVEKTVIDVGRGGRVRITDGKVGHAEQHNAAHTRIEPSAEIELELSIRTEEPAHVQGKHRKQLGIHAHINPENAVADLDGTTTGEFDEPAEQIDSAFNGHMQTFSWQCMDAD